MPNPHHTDPQPDERGRTISKEQMLEALRRLGDKLHDRGVSADVNIFGGAAMVLAYDTRVATREVDAIWSSHGEVRGAAVEVATELDLPDYWLNEQGTVFLPKDQDWIRLPVFDHPNLRVFTMAPRQQLAMKVLASRPGDEQDLRHLMAIVGLAAADDVVALTRSVFPDEEIPDRARLLIEDILSKHGLDSDSAP